MSKYIGPKCRLCRREGVKLFLKGQRCFTAKCEIEKNRPAPGQHGRKRKKMSDYAIHHREVLKLRKHYGVYKGVLETMMGKAQDIRGDSGENLLKLLERRIDNVLYRSGFCLSRSHARTIVTHKHVTVNGKRVNSPSYTLNAGDKIEFRTDKGRKIGKESFNVRNKQQDKTATWLKVVDVENPTCVVVQDPDPSEIQVEFDPLMIVEYLSR